METFIGQYYIDTEVCDKVVEFFKASDNKQQGCLGVDSRVDTKVKASTDVHVHNSELFQIDFYFDELQKVCDKYSEDYIWCNKYAPWNIDEGVNIQYYKPTEGYFNWHTERPCYMYPMGSRHLVFMTYLNDVTDGGQTEFYYQKLAIQPKKGLTLIWPADWTHTHRGVTSPTQEKYIVTGWFNFTD